MNKKAQATNKADRYRSVYGVEWEESSAGYLTIPVLEFLWGEPWNNLALDFVHTLRPSSVRVSNTGWWSVDSRCWRVTVALKRDNKTIERIEQEVEVGLHSAKNGHNLSCQLKEQKQDENFRLCLL